MPGIRRLCVFCGSSPGRRPAYTAAARELARGLVDRGITLVYGGAHAGLMGVLADTALAAGGEVIGIIPADLVAVEIAHEGLSELHVVASMSERKARMTELSDAFVALPGGFGTLEEFFEAVTAVQVGAHAKPCGLLNVDRYFDRLLGFLDHAVDEALLRPENREIVLVGNEPATLLDRLEERAVAGRPS